MKRVLMLNYEFPPLGGGGGVAAHALAKGLIQNGYEVDYLTSGFKDLPRHEVVDGIHVYRVWVPGRRELATANMVSMASYLLSAFWKGVQLCRKHDYAFVNTHFVVPTGPLGWILSKLFGIKNILSIHGGDIYDPTKKLSPHQHWYYRVAIRFLLNNADRVVAQSTNTKQNAVEFYNPKRAIEIIPLAYEARAFSKVPRATLGLENDTTYLMGIGRLVKRKGFETLIKALTFLDSGIKLIIVGEGPERAFLEGEITKHNLHDRVQLVGSVSDEEKFQYLAVANVFVLSSVHEGFGIVVQEAMQVGIPIVATNNGGQTDLIRDGVNGYLVPVGNAQLLAEAVQKTLAQPTRSLGDQVAQFSPRNIAQQYTDLVNSA